MEDDGGDGPYNVHSELSGIKGSIECGTLTEQQDQLLQGRIRTAIKTGVSFVSPFMGYYEDFSRRSRSTGTLTAGSVNSGSGKGRRMRVRGDRRHNLKKRKLSAARRDLPRRNTTGIVIN